MLSSLKTLFFFGALSALCQTAVAGAQYQVTLDTLSLVGHPAGPFYVYVAFTDGSGIGDVNNTASLSNFTFSGGSALGSPLVFGGANGSLATGITITDNSFVNFLVEQFAPGLHLGFSLTVTSNNDAGETPDRLT